MESPMTTHALRAALAALLLVTPLQERSRAADPTRETYLTTGFEMAERGAVSLRWRTIAWAPDVMRSMRRDPAQREQMNQRFALVLQSELKTPVALSLAGERLEPGSWRIGLFMDEAGAFQLTVLVKGETKRFALELSEARQNFPYLSFALTPAEEGLFALVFQWGSEYGRAVFEAAH
jgi:hypothetical protein